MREILFRGKRVDNGEWVKGAYGKHTSFDAMIMDRPYPTINGDLSALNFWVVDPTTVGQYTGLTDKNGVKIFEGDIVREKYFNDFYIGKVVFNKKTAGFEVWHDIVVGAYGEKATRKENFATCGRPEVIGNNSRHPRIVGEKQ